MTGEARAIARTTGGPVTLDRLREDLVRLGVVQGDLLLVHASLSALGFVPGGAPTVVEALRAVVGIHGLVVVPSFTSQLSDPVHWRAPPVPADWVEAIRTGGAPFDTTRTASRGVGIIPEQMRTTPGAERSRHPHQSFTALGTGAAYVLEPHPIEAWLGEGSPLARLYAADARVLFLGTGYETCTAFHLAEHRAGLLRSKKDGAPLVVDGVRRWVAFDAPDYDTSGYAALGAAFEAAGATTLGQVGMAVCRLFSLRAAVDFAEQWLKGGQRL